MGDRLDEIMILAKSRDVADRERLLIRLVDMCNGRPDDLRAPRVQDLLSQVFFYLVFQAEHDIRMRLAENIASSDWAPSGLINILAFDDIEIARPIIARSPILEDPDLIRIMVEATLEHQIEVARRRDISASVVEAILKAGRPEVLKALAENETARVSHDHLAELIQRSKDIEGLRSPLAEHAGLNAELASYLYTWVGVALRKSLASRFELDTKALDAALVVSVQQARAGEPRLQTMQPTESEEERRERQLVAKLDMSGQLRPSYLLKALKEKRLSLFVTALAALGRFEAPAVQKAVNASNAETLALACASVGIDRSVFSTMLELLRENNGGLPGAGEDNDRRAYQVFSKTSEKTAATLFRIAASKG